MSGRLPREVTQRIVADLARGHRPLSQIAARARVPVSTVEALRDHYGPAPEVLTRALIPWWHA